MAKVVVLGDSGVGKTCLLITHRGGAYPLDYVPSTFDDYSPRMGPPLPLSLFDTRGTLLSFPEELQGLVCQNVEFILLCYSVGDKTSFENIQKQWIGYVNTRCSNARVVLCATKTDLRDQQKDCITTDMGQKLSKQIGAIEYVEVSALKNTNVHVPFDTMIHFLKDKSAQNTRPKKRVCIIS